MKSVLHDDVVLDEVLQWVQCNLVIGVSLGLGYYLRHHRPRDQPGPLVKSVSPAEAGDVVAKIHGRTIPNLMLTAFLVRQTSL